MTIQARPSGTGTHVITTDVPARFEVNITPIGLVIFGYEGTETDTEQDPDLWYEIAVVSE